MNQQSAPAIRHYVRLAPGRIVKDGVAATAAQQPEEIYQALQHTYIKFFKMDVLCKWAWLGAEHLLGHGDAALYNSIGKEKTAVAFFTGRAAWI